MKTYIVKLINGIGKNFSTIIKCDNLDQVYKYIKDYPKCKCIGPEAIIRID